MDAEAIRSAVCDYVRHIEDAQYVQSTLAAHGMAAVLEVIRQMVREGTPEEVALGTLFVMDAGRNYFMPEAVTGEFRPAIITSGVMAAMTEAIYSKVCYVRSEILPTLGRLCMPEAIPALTKAIEHYRQYDPLLLPALLRELAWLTGQRDWRNVERAASNKHYLFRWAALEILNHWAVDPGMEGWPAQMDLAERLSRDASPFVSEEARCFCQRAALREAGPTLDRREAKRRHKALAREFRGMETFFGLRARFLHRRAEPDYTVAELDAFAQRLAATK